MALGVPKAELPSGLSESLIKQFGVVPEPLEVTWHNPKVAEASLELGGKVGEWDAADESLKSFAHMAVAAQAGCSWCLDIGYFQAQNQNLDLAAVSLVVENGRVTRIYAMANPRKLTRLDELAELAR